MKNALKSSIRQALTSPGFFAGLVGVVFVVLISSAEAIAEAFRAEGELAFGWHGRQALAALTSRAFTMTLPIWAALPYTSAFVDDLRSGFIKLFLHRTSVNGYILGRAAGCMLSGGLVLTGGLLAGFFLLWAVFSGQEAEQTAAMTPYLLQLLARCGPVFLCGALWATVGMLVSVATNNKYMAYAAPFIVYYLLLILHERYWTGYGLLSPVSWITGEGLHLGAWGAAAITAELLCVLLLALRAVGGRRLERI